MYRLSRLLVPLRKGKQKTLQHTVDILSTGGYIKQSTSGVYNILPLGFLVQQKIEGIIRNRLNEIDCNETSLCTLAAKEIWETSGRYREDEPGEFFRVQDSKYILAPTNEEEITSLLKTEVTSYKQLPLRLYQISRKYRNEKRPRGGLLRGREFVMKDLYSFDESADKAFESYDAVRSAYAKIFNDIGLPFVVAEADSGSIGGSMSHEYHYISPAGEDKVAKCGSCGYTANIERAKSTAGPADEVQFAIYNVRAPGDDIDKNLEKSVSVSVSSTYPLIVAHPRGRAVNELMLKQYFDLASDHKTMVTEDIDACASLIKDTSQYHVLFDRRVDHLTHLKDSLVTSNSANLLSCKTASIVEAKEGDLCNNCGSRLEFQTAIEVGHTFYLGTKYSKPFKLTISNQDGKSVLVEMGCYGIGVSRLISAIVELTRDSDGLAWPRSVSPFDAVIVSTNKEHAQAISEQLNSVNITNVWDDRTMQFGQLLSNAKSLGFPLIVVAGNKYTETGQIELERRTGGDRHVTSLKDLASTALKML